MSTSMSKLCKKFDFTGIKKTTDMYGKKVSLESLEFIDKYVPNYTTEEKMKFRITLKGYTCVKHLRVRMEIRYADSNIVAMTESKSFADIDEGCKVEKIFQVSMKNLAQGNYYFRLSVFVLSDMGTHIAYDDTPVRIPFEVVDTVSDRTAWMRQYWGSVRFDDIEICES
jgi:hypothetical protein